MACGCVWCRAEQGAAICTVVPGKYLVIPFGWPKVEGEEWYGVDAWNMGLTGEALAEPVPIEIRSGGSVLPNPVQFSPLPRSAPPRDRK